MYFLTRKMSTVCKEAYSKLQSCGCNMILFSGKAHVCLRVSPFPCDPEEACQRDHWRLGGQFEGVYVGTLLPHV